ncbi:MAG TPA: O-methyltransferase [Polyangiaceae bacterium]|nr:O-methyltransferase [Polyangiaceae bacterium]
MANKTWEQVDRYIGEKLLPKDAALDAALVASKAAGLPAIAVSPAQGKFLQLLARMVGARRILEIGTLGGYSTIWLARALPKEGRLVTLEAVAKHAEVARDNLARAGLEDVVDVRLGPALETLPRLQSENAGPFDLVFIDADKKNNTQYFEWALQLSRPGSLIIIDNVVRDGAVIDAASSDIDVQGARRVYERISREPRVSATALQTVGSKGYDGFAIALVTS